MFLALVILAVPLLSLALVLKLDNPAPAHVAGPTGVAWLDWWLKRMRVWHVVAAVALTGLIYAAMAESHNPEPFLFLAALVVLGLFLRAWRSELVALMGLPDDAFPGRSDKLVWGLLLVVLPPLGLWAFRAYRRAHWAEPAAGVKPAPLPEGPWS
jgi:hypothetical protein